jgi:hypothetical protein
MTLHDWLAIALDRRMPPSPALRAALQAALHQAEVDGCAADSEAAAARAAAILRADPAVRREVAQRQVAALVLAEGVALGATYDAEQEGWIPPQGMTVEAFLELLLARLRVAHAADRPT